MERKEQTFTQWFHVYISRFSDADLARALKTKHRSKPWRLKNLPPNLLPDWGDVLAILYWSEASLGFIEDVERRYDAVADMPRRRTSNTEQMVAVSPTTDRLPPSAERQALPRIPS